MSRCENKTKNSVPGSRFQLGFLQDFGFLFNVNGKELPSAQHPIMIEVPDVRLKVTVPSQKQQNKREGHPERY